ncbi:MAG: glycoside hydrolase family 127 protein, partial [Promethearchaeota archaeon]
MAMKDIPLKDVKITGNFWKRWQDLIRQVTIYHSFDKLKKTGRIDAFKLDWKPGRGIPPHVFWDSDVAKWIETASYALITKPDPDLKKMLDDLIDLVISAQQPDGYLNTHFTVVEPEKRWTNLRDLHELYCAGHLIEAAIAHHEATGSDRFLNAMIKYADYIDAVFGPENGKLKGYPGHQEIELALVKLYKITRNEKYLKLAKFFLDERGQIPFYFEIEAEKRGEKPKSFDRAIKDREYRQSHLPVRDQEEIVGHAVRAQYMYSAMVDVGYLTRDDDLINAARKIWNDTTLKKMYITGGVGSTRTNEGITKAYDLPNETAYAETCAGIALFLWSYRLLSIDKDSKYADMMERALYNGILSGISISGDKFFYENPLANDPRNPDLVNHVRASWFP